MPTSMFFPLVPPISELFNFKLLILPCDDVSSVPVLVCCMFFVSQKPIIKRSPNRIKTDGDFFWNICDFWEVKSTRDGARGGQEIEGHAPGRQARPGLSWAPCKVVDALLLPQES